LKQFDIYLVDLNPTIGREQSGFRPALIISNNYENLLDIVTIIPITSLKSGRKIYPNEVLIEDLLEKTSILHLIILKALFNLLVFSINRK
jgi:mRNA interferase MazF